MKVFQNVIDYNSQNFKKLNQLNTILNSYYKGSLISYRRYTPSCEQVFYLSLHKEWLFLSMNNDFVTTSLSEERISSLKYNVQKNFLWPNNKKLDDSAYDALYSLNICNGISVYYKNKAYVEVWGFASNSSNDKFQEFFIQNEDIMHIFIQNYREQNYDILFPEKINDFLIDTGIKNIKEYTNDIYKDEFLNLIKQTRVKLPDIQYSFTIKQIICLYLYSHGNSMKTIGKKINISPRTAETHIHAATLKLNCINSQSASCLLTDIMPLGLEELIKNHII